jgi:hypothetical protein
VPRMASTMPPVITARLPMMASVTPTARSAARRRPSLGADAAAAIGGRCIQVRSRVVGVESRICCLSFACWGVVACDSLEDARELFDLRRSEPFE